MVSSSTSFLSPVDGGMLEDAQISGKNGFTYLIRGTLKFLPKDHSIWLLPGSIGRGRAVATRQGRIRSSICAMGRPYLFTNLVQMDNYKCRSCAINISAIFRLLPKIRERKTFIRRPQKMREYSYSFGSQPKILYYHRPVMTRS